MFTNGLENTQLGHRGSPDWATPPGVTGGFSMAVLTLSSRLVVAAVLVAAMFLSGLPQAPAVLATESVDETVDAPSEPAPSADAREEIPALRSRFSKTYKTNDLAMHETEVSPSPIHFKDGAGKWMPIDPTLVQESVGVFTDRANGSDLRLRVAADSPRLTRLEVAAGVSVGFSLRGAQPSQGSASGASMLYRKVLPGVDLRLTSLPIGVKEDVVLASANTPRSFVFPLTLKGVTAAMASDGDVVFRDGSGVERARIPHGWMQDASGRDAESGVISEGVTYDLIEGGKALRMTLDDAWLDDPARVYPVTVDPTITTTTTKGANGDDIGDTFITSTTNESFYTNNNLKIGYAGGARHVSYVKFNFDGIPALKAADGSVPDEIITSDLMLFNWHSETCADRSVQVRRVTEVHNIVNIRWNEPDRPDSTTVGGASSNESHGLAGVCDNKMIAYPLAETTRNWLGTPDKTADWINQGVEVRAGDGLDPSFYKSFASARNIDCCYPRLRVFHNRRPDVPTRVGPPEGALVRASSATLQARYSDFDTDTGHVEFEVSGDATPGLSRVSVANGGTASYDTGPLADGTYSWRVRSTDGRLFSAFSPWFSFTIDATKPNPPSDLKSTSHALSTASPDRTIDVSWLGGSDATSGMAGHSWAFTTSRDIHANDSPDPVTTTADSRRPLGRHLAVTPHRRALAACESGRQGRQRQRRRGTWTIRGRWTARHPTIAVAGRRRGGWRPKAGGVGTLHGPRRGR